MTKIAILYFSGTHVTEEYAEVIRAELIRLGCDARHLHVATDRYTPTYLKPRDAHGTSLAAEHSRYDTKNRSRTSSRWEQAVIRSLDELLPDVDAVIVLDQVEEADQGVVTASVRAALAPHVVGASVHLPSAMWLVSSAPTR